MKTSVFVDPQTTGSKGLNVVNPVVIDGAVLSPEALKFLTCMQADDNAYIHEIREHLINVTSHLINATEYVEDKESSQIISEMRYLNKFITSIQCLSAQSIITACICFFAA